MIESPHFFAGIQRGQTVLAELPPGHDRNEWIILHNPSANTPEETDFHRGYWQAMSLTEWPSRANSVQRDPLRVNNIALEVLGEIRAQDAHESDETIRHGTLEADLAWLVRNSTAERGDLIRAAAAVFMEIALRDAGSKDRPPVVQGETMPDSDDARYVLTMHRKQAELLVMALDFYARIGIGQLEELARHSAVPTNRPHDAIRHTDMLIQAIKENLFGLSSNASMGIYNPEVPDAVRILWDIKNVVRHRLAWDRAGNPPTRSLASMGTVDFDQPVQAGSLPLVEIEQAPVNFDGGKEAGWQV